MSKIVKGRYRNGVVEPLEPVELSEDEMVEIIVPETRTANDSAFPSSFGMWRDLVPEEFIEEVYRERVRGSRPPVDL